jgi:hypothetical protein
MVAAVRAVVQAVRELAVLEEQAHQELYLEFL